MYFPPNYRKCVAVQHHDDSSSTPPNVVKSRGRCWSGASDFLSVTMEQELERLQAELRRKDAALMTAAALGKQLVDRESVLRTELETAKTSSQSAQQELKQFWSRNTQLLDQARRALSPLRRRVASCSHRQPPRLSTDTVNPHCLSPFCVVFDLRSCAAVDAPVCEPRYEPRAE